MCSRPRLHIARALAADGKRIRGANRNGDGHHETVALHESGAPFALLNFDGGELAAMHDLLERSDIGGKVITLDALHTPDREAHNARIMSSSSRETPRRPSTASIGRGTPPAASRRSSTRRTADWSSVRSASHLTA